MTTPIGELVLNGPPPSEAIEFFRAKGYAPPDARFDWRDWWGEAHARGFVVAKAMQDEVLETIRAEVDAALAGGGTLEQFKAALRPKLQALGWWGRQDRVDPLTGELRSVQLGSERRLRVIFDTNLRTAYAAGRWVRIQRVKAAFPYLWYRQIPRETKREEHEPFDGLILPVDHPFWRTHYPPNGWFCGCTVRQLSERKLRQMGRSVSPDPDFGRTRYVNRRTGRAESIPKGIAPGFQQNPGAIFQDALERIEEVAPELPPRVRGIERALIAEAHERGLRTGVEHLGAYDLDTGQELAWSSGNSFGVNPSPDVWAAIRDPARRIAIVHNHPQAGGGFSDADLSAAATYRGIASLVAVAHDGSVHRMTDVRPEVAGIAEGLMASLLDAVVRRARRRDVSPDQVALVVTEIVAAALDRAGLIRYSAAISPAARLRLGRFGQRWVESLIRATVRVIG